MPTYEEGKLVVKSESWNVWGTSLTQQGIKEGIKERTPSSWFRASIDGKLGDGTAVTTIFVEAHREIYSEPLKAWVKPIVAFSFAKDGDENAPPILVTVLEGSNDMKTSIVNLGGNLSFGSGSQSDGALWNFLQQGNTVFHAEAFLVHNKG